MASLLATVHLDGRRRVEGILREYVVWTINNYSTSFEVRFIFTPEWPPMPRGLTSIILSLYYTSYCLPDILHIVRNTFL